MHVSKYFQGQFIHCLKFLTSSLKIHSFSHYMYIGTYVCMSCTIFSLFLISLHLPVRLTASDIMEPNLTYVYPHTRIQSLVSILRTTVYHAFPVVTENRDNEKEFMKGNILISNNIKFKVQNLTNRYQYLLFGPQDGANGLFLRLAQYHRNDRVVF